MATGARRNPELVMSTDSDTQREESRNPPEASGGSADPLATTLMSDRQNEFYAALIEDVRWIHKHGFTSHLDSSRIPALAELAQVLSPKSVSLRQAVSQALKEAIGQAAPELVSMFVRSDHGKIVRGLAALFGLPEASPKGVEARYKLAGPYLGYPRGYGALAHGERNRRKVIPTALNEVVVQLDSLGRANGFSYTGRFVVNATADATNQTYPELADEIIYRTASFEERFPPQLSRHGPQDYESLQRLIGECLNEVDEIRKVGFELADSNEALHALRALAKHRLDVLASGAYKADCSASYLFSDWFHLRRLDHQQTHGLEDYLLWAIYQFDSSFAIVGIAELLGVGRYRDIPASQRLDRAAISLGYWSGDDFERSQVDRKYLRLLIVVMTRGAARFGFFGSGDHALNYRPRTDF